MLKKKNSKYSRLVDNQLCNANKNNSNFFLAKFPSTICAVIIRLLELSSVLHYRWLDKVTLYKSNEFSSGKFGLIINA
jgi:hypothetical protein